MSSVYEIVFDDFRQELEALDALVDAAKGYAPRPRVAASNSITLLLAATFEEFVRQLARQFAKDTVSKAGHIGDLPDKLVETAWKRLVVEISRIKSSGGRKSEAIDAAARLAKNKFDLVYAFVTGDISQDIYESLIHNDNNMRTGEINSLFSISGNPDVCLQIADDSDVMDFFGLSDSKKAHGALIAAIDDFFERRNQVAHSLNSASSTGPDGVQKDISFFRAVGSSLARKAEQKAGGGIIATPPSPAAPAPPYSTTKSGT